MREYGTDGHCLVEKNNESAKEEQILYKFDMALLIVYAFLCDIELNYAETLFEDLNGLRTSQTILNFVSGDRHEKFSNFSMFLIAQ
jgi:hypothetical protein